MAVFAGYGTEDPATQAMSCAAANPPVPTDRWLGRAGAFHLPLGRPCGRGWFLLRKSALDLIDSTADHNLVFSGSDTAHVRTLSPITLLSAECVTPGSSLDANAVYCCEVVDRRFHLARIALSPTTGGKAYNLVKPDGNTSSPYLTGTLNAGVAWTWQQVVQDLATALGIGTLTLPFTPAGTPESLVYFAPAFAWAALCDVLDRLACAVEYNPEANTFAIVRLGSTDATSALAQTSLNGVRLWDGYNSEAVRGWRPETVYVGFPRLPTPAAGTSPMYVVPVALTATAGVVAGTSVQIWDGTIAKGATGTPSNVATLTTVAAERAADWLRKRSVYERPLLRIYRDYQSGNSLLGSTIGQVSYDDRGGPFATAVGSTTDGALPNWHPWGQSSTPPEQPGGGYPGGGGGSPQSYGPQPQLYAQPAPYSSPWWPFPYSTNGGLLNVVLSLEGGFLTLTRTRLSPEGDVTTDSDTIDVCLLTDCCGATAITIDASVRHTALGASLRSAVILTSGTAFFNATGTTGGSGALTYEWYWDDPIAATYPGSPDATGSTASHAFSTEGTHQVLLIVRDADGCDVDRMVLPVHVVAATPECDCEANCPSGAPYGYSLVVENGTGDFELYNGTWEIPLTEIVDEDVLGTDETCIYQLTVIDKGLTVPDRFGFNVAPEEGADPAMTVTIFRESATIATYTPDYAPDASPCCDAGPNNTAADTYALYLTGTVPQIDGPTPLNEDCDCECSEMCESYSTGTGATEVFMVGQEGTCDWVGSRPPDFAWTLVYLGDGDWTMTNSVDGSAYATNDWDGTGTETFAKTAGPGAATVDVSCAD